MIPTNRVLINRQRQRLSDQTLISTKAPLPQASLMMTARGLPGCSSSEETSSRDRLYAEHSKEVGRDRRALDSFRFCKSG